MSKTGMKEVIYFYLPKERREAKIKEKSDASEITEIDLKLTEREKHHLVNELIQATMDSEPGVARLAAMKLDQGKCQREVRLYRIYDREKKAVGWYDSQGRLMIERPLFEFEEDILKQGFSLEK